MRLLVVRAKAERLDGERDQWGTDKLHARPVMWEKTLSKQKSGYRDL